MPSIVEDSKVATQRVLISPPKGWLDLGLGEFWRYRELLYFFAWRDLKVRYKQTAIGAAWAVIQPFLIMIVFTIFFGELLELPSDGLPAPLFYFSALLPWTYFVSAMSNSANSLVTNQGIITKTYFPRLILPFGAVIPPLVDFGIALVVLVGMMFFYGVTPTFAFLTVPLFLLLALASALAVGLWLGALMAIYRDVRHVLPFIIQVWFFASPVVYSAKILPGSLQTLYGLNPMAGVIAGVRWAVTGEGGPPASMILISSTVVLIALIGGLLFFRSRETLIADVV
jgi:lipopolysaccharide transport system permease protein